MSFRTFLFWLHLVAGLISGLSIGLMCVTGTVLAFEKELIAWSERDARLIELPPAGTPRFSLDQLQAKLRAAHPDARPASIVFQNDPRAAVAFTVGRSGGFYVNPYTGEVRQPASTAMSRFMRTTTDLHRYLGFQGEDSRPVGKLINGICNLAFFVLAVTGLYLWMPRAWSWRAVRPAIWFRQNTSAKARDFNWHNAIGFWTAPILIVLTLTAVPISFRWGANLINTLTGTPAAAPGAPGPGGGPSATVVVTPPASDAKPLTTDALVAAIQTAAPAWRTLTLRLPGGGGPGGPGERGGRGGETRPQTPATAGTPAATPGPTASAVTFTLREWTSWPRTATSTLVVNPFTAEILKRTGYADLPAAQQVRSWTRFLHTGEALGRLGQFVAGLACLGGVVLVYTGFALSWRRFFGKKPAAQTSST